MKILWVSNSPIGPAASILGSYYDGSSGGWIQSEFEKIDNKNHDFFFLCSSRHVKKETFVHKKSELGEVYCVHSPRMCYGIKNPNYLVKQIKRIIQMVSPDIIHIWGTETCISNIVASIDTNCKKVVFIQGIIGVHAKYIGCDYRSGITKKYSIRRSFFDFLLSRVQIKHFMKQIEIERDTIQKCGNIICEGYLTNGYFGSFKSNINFYDYKLLPNKVFFDNKWAYDKCTKHTIFTIYGSGIDKGLHQLLKAVSIVKKIYPNVRLLVPGPFRVDQNNNLIPSSFYEKILAKIIYETGIKNNVVFLGKLKPEQMAEQMSLSNCFVNPSIMENHALSLREALCVGTPCITTNCGNVLDFIEHGKNGYIYRFEEFEVLATYILRVFEHCNKTPAANGYLLESKNLLDVYKNILKVNL